MMAELNEIFCVNIRGLASPTKLLQLLDKIEKLRKSKTFCILLQETKIWKLTVQHEKILKINKLKYEFVPAIMNSGGLLTIVPQNCESTKSLEKQTHV